MSTQFFYHFIYLIGAIVAHRLISKAYEAKPPESMRQAVGLADPASLEKSKKIVLFVGSLFSWAYVGFHVLCFLRGFFFYKPDNQTDHERR